MPSKIRTLLFPCLVTLGLYFSGFLVFATPVPVVFFVLRRHPKEAVLRFFAVLASVVALIYFGTVFFLSHAEPLAQQNGLGLLPLPSLGLALQLGVLRGGVVGLGHFGLYAVMGFLIARVYQHQNAEAPRFIFYFTTALFVCAGIALLIVIGPHLPHLVDLYRAQTLAGIKDFVGAQEKANVGIEKIVVLRSLIPDVVKHSVYLLPFGFWCYVVCLFLLNLFLFKTYFLRGQQRPSLPVNMESKPLSSTQVKAVQPPVFTLINFKMPFIVVWLVIALAGVLLFNARFGHSLFLIYASLNVLAALLFVHFLQGFAVVIHFIDRKQIFGPFRFFAYFVLVFLMMSVPFVLPIILILGFVEHWIDLRKDKNQGSIMKGQA